MEKSFLSQRTKFMDFFKDINNFVSQEMQHSFLLAFYEIPF